MKECNTTSTRDLRSSDLEISGDYLGYKKHKPGLSPDEFGHALKSVWTSDNDIRIHWDRCAGRCDTYETHMNETRSDANEPRDQLESSPYRGRCRTGRRVEQKVGVRYLGARCTVIRYVVRCGRDATRVSPRPPIPVAVQVRDTPCPDTIDQNGTYLLDETPSTVNSNVQRVYDPRCDYVSS